MSDDVLDVARRLARALDEEDEVAARAVLADDCAYETGAEALRGPEAILASYREAAASAVERFDAVRYESRVERAGPSAAVITYTDHLRLGDRRHSYRCRQHVVVGASGTVTSIRHEDIPGETERLHAFERG